MIALAKPCPFCGNEIDTTDNDTIHKSATAWKDVNGQRYYISYMEANSGRCYEIHCNTIYGGCGATITDDSIEEVIAKWNNRVECKC